jgi:hypothetical protein
MTEKQQERVSYLQYLNTFLLTLICGFSIMAASTLKDVSDKQEKFGIELIRMKTIQEGDLSLGADVSERLRAVETGSFNDIKSWVDLNYVRKPQK